MPARRVRWFSTGSWGADGSLQVLNVLAEVDPDSLTAVQPELALAAVAIVRQWRYEPGRLNDVPVDVPITVRSTSSTSRSGPPPRLHRDDTSRPPGAGAAARPACGRHHDTSRPPDGAGLPDFDFGGANGGLTAANTAARSAVIAAGPQR